MRDYTDASTQTTTSETVGEQSITKPLKEETTEEQTLANPPKKEKDNSWLLENANLDQVVLQLDLKDMQESANQVTIKAGYQLLCSYSWKNTDTPDIHGPPVIYVPGTPAAFSAREFTPPAIPPPHPDCPREHASPDKKIFNSIHLTPDTGRQWVDQHAARARTYQFEPIFQALCVLDPEAHFDNIDIVVNRNSMQMLLKYINAKSSQPLLLDLDIVGSTLFLGRRVKHAKVTSAPGSYGRSFESYFTCENPELENADGHHRVLRYDFGGLNMVVRIEADAYIPDTEYDVDEPVMPHPFFDPELSPAEGITHSMQTAIVPKGTLARHFLTVELKSNDKVKPLEQMWLGRTPNAFLGRHKAGVLTQAAVEKVTSEDFEDWELKNQASLRKLAWLLRELRTVVKEQTGEGAAVLVVMGKGQPMYVYEMKKKVGALPREIVERFWNDLD